MTEEWHFFWSSGAKTQIQNHGLHLQKLGLNLIRKIQSCLDWIQGTSVLTLIFKEFCLPFSTRFITFYFSVAQERVHRKWRAHSLSNAWDFRSYFKAARLCYLISFKKKKEKKDLFCILVGCLCWVFFIQCKPLRPYWYFHRHLEFLLNKGI